PKPAPAPQLETPYKTPREAAARRYRADGLSVAIWLGVAPGPAAIKAALAVTDGRAAKTPYSKVSNSTRRFLWAHSSLLSRHTGMFSPSACTTIRSPSTPQRTSHLATLPARLAESS